MLTLPDLDQYSSTSFAGWPTNTRTFFSPYDKPHAVLRALVQSTEHSLVLAMYGFDDDELLADIQRALHNPAVFVQISLDSSQAGGVHERALLAKADLPGNSVAAGRSSRGAIMHLKLGVVDGRFRFGGSTNWSTSGETLQDNELTVVEDPAVCAQARTTMDLVHTDMLQQMARKAAP